MSSDPPKKSRNKSSGSADRKRNSLGEGRRAHPEASRHRDRASNRDRFGWVLTVSIIFHLVIVLGVSFVLPSEAGSTRFSPPLKIILVDTADDEANPDADTLAQANSSGEEDPSILPLLPVVDQSVAQARAETQEKLLLEQQADARFNPEQFDQPDPDTGAGPTRDELTKSINLAFLNSQAKPRERFVSADARSSEIAPYLENWRLLVERVGNLNYPDAAKQLEIEGELVMDVTIRADGSVTDVRILRSSGQKVLDDGAERIVHIAAPYEPFTPAMNKEYDTLHIIRTWRFSQNTVTDVTQ